MQGSDYAAANGFMDAYLTDAMRKWQRVNVTDTACRLF